MKKCKYAKNYKGIHPPRCDGGNGCDACRKKYLAKHSRDLPPFEPTSDFAVISIKRGRDGMKKLVEKNVEVEVTITGRISGVWGKDDGIDREFSLDINSLKLGKAVLVPKDKLGRRYALAAEVKPGDKLQLDGDFTCCKKNAVVTVKRNTKSVRGCPDAAKPTGIGSLYFNCGEGKHFLDSQLGFTPETEGALVGLYPMSKRKK
jgi:hypothetical protein